MSSMPNTSPGGSYVCDTPPAPRLAPESTKPLPVHLNNHTTEEELEEEQVSPMVQGTGAEQRSKEMASVSFPPPGRKLCVRHQRMADEGTNLKLQQSLDRLPVGERESVSTIWSIFSSSSHPRRALILQGLLTMCCFSQLSLLTEQLAHLIRIDPFTVCPREVSLKVLGYLDATSLCRASQVSKRWKNLADDDILWRSICEQHIGTKCHKCGWGLPVLENQRRYLHSASPCPSPDLSFMKRSLEDVSGTFTPPLKRPRSEITPKSPEEPCPRYPPFSANECRIASSSSILTAEVPPKRECTRPWKDVYSERMTIERNWRRGRCKVRTLRGHKDGVMCLQYSETLSHPAFPVLITGSYDSTAKVWNLETGVVLHTLEGHSQPIRALQFDNCKLITGSMDSTIKVWDWRRGKCIRTLTGHTEGVVSLNFDSNVLASGSVDASIKVWNLRTGHAFTLRGHRDWVNSVQLWDSNSGTSSITSSASANDAPGSPQIDPGKMLFSASDDGSIRLWDLTLRTCVRHFVGHVAQVQSMRLLLADECGSSSETSQDSDSDSDSDSETVDIDMTPPSSSPSTPPSYGEQQLDIVPTLPKIPKSKTPVLISGSLDNTIKVWDIETGKTVKTFFGHIEGVWGVAADKMRLVSASHDRTIKVWNREDARCISTLVGHAGSVSCIALGEDKLISGSDDHTVKVWSFA